MIEFFFECQRRPKVLTTIRSTRPATRPTDILMCLFDITPLSLGVVPCRNSGGTVLFRAFCIRMLGSNLFDHLCPCVVSWRWPPSLWSHCVNFIAKKLCEKSATICWLHVITIRRSYTINIPDQMRQLHEALISWSMKAIWKIYEDQSSRHSWLALGRSCRWSVAPRLGEWEPICLLTLKLEE